MDRFCYQIFQICQAKRLVTSGDKIMISLSGGIDSTCLFRILTSFREKLDIELHVAHFNHGLREESKEEEIFVSRLSAEFNVPFSVMRATHFDKSKGMQNEARTWRYDHLKKLLETKRFNKIALGHHLDDLVETQIWRIIRGASLFSFSPILEEAPPYIRPLLTIPKKELEDYLKKIQQPWRDDQSNFSTDYTRNAIRNQIIPMMNNTADGDRFENKMLALYQDSLNLKSMFDSTVPAITYEVEALHYDTITALPRLFALELIHRFLIFHGQEDITRANLESVLNLAESGRGDWTIQFKKGLDIFGNRKMIQLRHRETKNG